jgi:hypothetical protein
MEAISNVMASSARGVRSGKRIELTKRRNFSTRILVFADAL